MSAYSSRIALMTGLICAGLLLAAFYLEFVSGLVPCALCLAQRAMFALIGIACVLYLLPFYGSRLIFGLLSLLGSGLGVWLASRQLWLQSIPEDQLPACGPDIYYILERHNVFEGLKTMFFGSGNCAEVQWIFLNLSIPGWTLLFYIFTASISVWLILFRGPRQFRLFNN